jgi:predicted enzyme related to lactoylglutathione lyase
VTLPHADQEDDGCGLFFEAIDPSGNIIQVQANDGEIPAEHPRVEAIFNLEMPVSDVRKSASFYADILGFNLLREPDDQMAIVKTGPYYKQRFGYYDVQEFGFFLFHHGEKNVLHFEDIHGQVQECLVLQADDVEALHIQLSEQGEYIVKPRMNDERQFSFHVVDPDGNLIRVLPREYTYGHSLGTLGVTV